MMMIFIVIKRDTLVTKNAYETCASTNIGKQSVSSVAVELWQDLPTSFKNPNTFTFSGKVKEFLLKT